MYAKFKVKADRAFDNIKKGGKNKLVTRMAKRGHKLTLAGGIIENPVFLYLY